VQLLFCGQSLIHADSAKHQSCQLRRTYEKNINFNAYGSVIADGLYGGAGRTRPPFRRSNDRAFFAAGGGAGGGTVLLLQ
jgi:hypothetical protein